MSQQSMNHRRRERSTRSKVWGKGAEKSRLARLIRNGAACVSLLSSCDLSALVPLLLRVSVYLFSQRVALNQYDY